MSAGWSPERRAAASERMKKMRAEGKVPSAPPRRAPKSSPAAPGPTTKPRPKPAQPDYRPGVAGLLQLVAGPLLIAGQVKPAFGADAVAVANAAPGIAEAVNDLAHENPSVAQALDKILAVGPYGAILAAVIPLGMQILTNHRVLPVEITGHLGAVPPEKLYQPQTLEEYLAAGAASDAAVDEAA